MKIESYETAIQAVAKGQLLPKLNSGLPLLHAALVNSLPCSSTQEPLCATAGEWTVAGTELGFLGATNLRIHPLWRS